MSWGWGWGWGKKKMLNMHKSSMKVVSFVRLTRRILTSSQVTIHNPISKLGWKAPSYLYDGKWKYYWKYVFWRKIMIWERKWKMHCFAGLNWPFKLNFLILSFLPNGKFNVSIIIIVSVSFSPPCHPATAIKSRIAFIITGSIAH